MKSGNVFVSSRANMGSLALGLWLASVLLISLSEATTNQTYATTSIERKQVETENTSNLDASKVDKSQIAPKIKKSEYRTRSARLFGHKKAPSVSFPDAPIHGDPSVSAGSLLADHNLANHDLLSTIQANDASNFASFGETPAQTTDSASPNVAGLYGRQAHSVSQYIGHPSYQSPYSNQDSLAGYSSPSQQQHLAQSTKNFHHHANKLNHVNYPDRGLYHDQIFEHGMSQLWSPSRSHGILSSAFAVLPHWAGGFGLSEIICGIIALAIGAVILGAPFFLIYLVLMGNFSGSGTLSLANPIQNTTASVGRRKRSVLWERVSLKSNRKHQTELSSLVDGAMNSLGPLIDLDKVAASFKFLLSAVDKFTQTNSK